MEGIWTNRPFPGVASDEMKERVLLWWEVQFLESRRGDRSLCTSFISQGFCTRKLLQKSSESSRTYSFIHARNKRITRTAISVAFNHCYWCLCCSCVLKSDSFFFLSEQTIIIIRAVFKNNQSQWQVINLAQRRCPAVICKYSRR